MEQGGEKIVLTKIRREFEMRKEKNPRYSIRSFSALLKINSSTMSKILRGDRRLTYDMANRILSRLPISDRVRRELLLSYGSDPKQVTNELSFRVLTEDELAAIAGWQCYAILGALEVPKIPPTSASIAKAIGAPKDLVTKSVDVLKKIGVIEEDGRRLTLTGQMLTTSDNIPSCALRRAHAEYIEKSLEALQAATKNADFSGITMAISKARLPDAQRQIREFRRSLAVLLNEGNKDAVYRLNVQLFPLG